MKSVLLRLDSQLLTVEKWLAGSLLGAMALLLVAGVFFRYVLGTPFVWSESVSRLLIVWLTFIGSSIAFAEKKHITVDSILYFLPGMVRPVIRMCIFALVAVTLGYMTYLGYLYCLSVSRNTSPMLGISLVYFSMAMPITFFIGLLHIFVNVFLKRDFLVFESALDEI
ncbi:TRAP transporter small permease [Halomonas sp. PAMB 3264]|uniref:TRAP transporter small permease n=1 Tax=Halomonas sp. PAMB 3264 TaxID=3075222 RepID=UPI0028A27078|nr:TRAP transporter small permease [Halomonas sp. PAMB 3264]WNL41839.1 TRAP transporter small permease [Halomonas sp. PAMB 3264]